MNTVILKLDDYERLLTDKHIAQEELRHERRKNEHFNDIKRYVLERSLDDYIIKNNNYTLEELTDITSYSFGLNAPLKLLSLGIDFEEMIEFIKFKYEEAHREEQKNDD